MRLISTGLQRNRGEMVHFDENQYIGLHVVRDSERNPSIRVSVSGERNYDLYLSPEEVLAFLLELPADCIAQAAVNADLDIDRATRFPELVKQLTLGAIARQNANLAGQTV
jgi:hypothetical protein